MDTTINVGLCKKLIALEIEKARLENELKRTVADIKSLWTPILNDMARAGMKSIPFASGTRVEQRQTLYCNKASGVSMPEATAALNRCGLGGMVSEAYSPSALKDWVRGILEEIKETGGIPPEDLNELLPESLQELFRVGDNFSVVVYGARAKALEKELTNAEDSDEERTSEEGGEELCGIPGPGPSRKFDGESPF